MASAAPRIFSFTTVFASEIPAEALKTTRAERDTTNDLPFKGWFDGNAEACIKEAKLATLFVPFSYFFTDIDKGGRGIDAEKVDADYVKTKLRDQFNSWQGKTKVIVAPVVRAPSTSGTDKNGKAITKVGKVLKEEVSYNTERGSLSIVMMERTGKEKNLPGAKELGVTEPGIQLWLRHTAEAAAKQEAAKATAAANAAGATAKTA